MQVNQSLKNKFIQLYGEGEVVISSAPGRVNIIGDHTDYNEGFVLPAAINFNTRVLARKRNDNYINVVALDINNEQVSFELTNIESGEDGTWSNYVKGTLLVLKSAGFQFDGADLLISGDIPQGAGLSSSAAFEIAILKSFCELYKLDLTGIQAAQLGQKAENEFVGCQCGIMDQLISALGQERHAMLLDCRDLSYKYANIPENLAIMIIDSKVKRQLVDSEYNIRREQCEKVAKHFSKPSLREVSLQELEQNRSLLDDVLFRRAKHVITENQRTLAAYDALNDENLALMSKLMMQSHLSLKNDFEVSTSEIDKLVEIVATELGEKVGVRMTGGGFGGCVVAVLPKERAEVLAKKVLDKYLSETRITAQIHLCTAEQGAFF